MRTNEDPIAYSTKNENLLSVHRIILYYIILQPATAVDVVCVGVDDQITDVADGCATLLVNEMLY